MLVIDIIDWNDDTKLTMFKARLNEALESHDVGSDWVSEGPELRFAMIGASSSATSPSSRAAMLQTELPGRALGWFHLHPQEAE